MRGTPPAEPGADSVVVMASRVRESGSPRLCRGFWSTMYLRQGPVVEAENSRNSVRVHSGALEPVVAERVELLGRRGDGRALRVCWFGEGEGFEAGRGRVARTCFKTGTEF